MIISIFKIIRITKKSNNVKTMFTKVHLINTTAFSKIKNLSLPDELGINNRKYVSHFIITVLTLGNLNVNNPRNMSFGFSASSAHNDLYPHVSR